MQFKSNIYRFKWRVLVLQLIPVRLRQPKLTALAMALVSPIAFLYVQFVNFKRSVEYELTITPQVCFLEKMLNDYFDYEQRRIYISDADFFEPMDLWLESEGSEKGNTMYTSATEGAAEYAFYTESESLIGGADFLVIVPEDVVDIDRMKSLLTKYKLPTKNFSIKNE